MAMRVRDAMRALCGGETAAEAAKRAELERLRGEMARVAACAGDARKAADAAADRARDAGVRARALADSERADSTRFVDDVAG